MSLHAKRILMMRPRVLVAAPTKQQTRPPFFFQQLQRASYWQEIVKIRQFGGERKHEDPERVSLRFQEARRGKDGAVLMDLHEYNDRHEKKWMKRKRLQEQKRYEFDKKHVLDLANYIQFVRAAEDPENNNDESSSKPQGRDGKKQW